MVRFGRIRIFSGRGSNKATERGASTATDSVADDGDDGKSEATEQHAHLSPKEAFLKFDTDSSGDIDEDEFFFLLESVGIKGKLEYQEKLFRRYVKPGSKTIDYESFKAAWLLLGNPKKELDDRAVTIPKFATRYQLIRLLEKTLEDEERLEALAKAEADRYRRIQDVESLRTSYIERAQARAGLELAAALDAAGQVYVLGTGAHGQFSATPKRDFLSTSSFHQVGGELIQSLWEDRVRNKGNRANSNTAGIWGRRPRNKVVLTDNAVLALTDNGILAWGGADNWQELLEERPTRMNRQQTPSQTTPRSSALLMNNERAHQKHLAMIQEEMNETETKSASEIEGLEIALKYYGQWPSHFDGTYDVHMVREHFLACTSLDQLLHSLLLRGKPCEGSGLSKLEMAAMLATDIRLEREVLGDPGAKELCDLEYEINDLEKREKKKSANFQRLKFNEKWEPLSKLQKQRVVAEEKREIEERRINRSRQDKEYEHWNARRVDNEKSSVVERGGLLAGSITARGRSIQTPRGVSQCLDIAAGSNHAAILVQDERSRGSLYTWGVSSLGRLGRGNGEHGASDANCPTIVQELKGTSITDVSLGQSHSAAVSSSGALYMWGSGSSGQLGFGMMPDGKGFCCTSPTKLLIPSCRVRKVSCGASHTACIGAAGEVYVWGLGDGGRLGIGDLTTQHTPVLVESLLHENVCDVSCGTSTTMLLTETKSTGTNSRTSVKRIMGGRLYVAGPKNVLGSSFPSFGELECLKQKPLTIKSISAGYSHQSFVSASGELYCWGLNLHGCCGQDEGTRFLPDPAKVSSLYEAPKNLSFGKMSCQLSSRYDDVAGLSACNAVDGNVDGSDLAHTQFEANAYFDVDLGGQVHVTNVRLWNRTDEPDDAALSNDMFSKRLFPCYIMISQFPFPTDLDGKDGLDAALKQCVATIRLVEDKRLSNWDVPKFTVGRYVRVQLEGTNFLHFAQLEVFGHESRSHGPITSCSAGKFVTAAVVGGIEDRRGIEAAYKRAINADWYNAEILRQFSCYSDEYRKGGSPSANNATCLLCVGDEECEICTLKSTFSRELQEILQSGDYRLEDLASHLLSAGNIEQSIAADTITAKSCNSVDAGKAKNVLPMLLKLKHRHSKKKSTGASEPRMNGPSSWL